MNVLIVDDHPMVLEYLSSVVARAFEGATVRTATDLQAALEVARQGGLDMALLDLGLPGCGGIESLLAFREKFPEVRIVIVSGQDEPSLVRGALAAGASGFIPKSSGPKVVVGALRLIGEGGKYFPPEALADEGGRSPEAALTDRQREVLHLLLRGKTIGQVARELGIAEPTAKHHAHAVYAAYGVSSRADLLVAANRRGAASG
jgi:DNA-binding NarL/FixJ family response regulator